MNAIETATTTAPEQTRETDFRIFLQEELVRRCRRNPAYSLRAFARALDCDVPTLGKILKGKRGIGRITIERFGLRLGLEPDEIQRFVHRNRETRRRGWSSGAAGPTYEQVVLDQFKLIADWYHYGILELMRVDHFRPDPAWVSSALRISVHEVHAAIERLQRAGMLEVTDDGRWVDLTGGTSTTTGSPFTAAAFRKLQRQVLEMAIQALEEVPMDLRDQTSMTMAIDSSLIPEARNRIKAFRRDLAKFLSRGKRRDAVYQLGISLFPLSHE